MSDTNRIGKETDSREKTEDTYTAPMYSGYFLFVYDFCESTVRVIGKKPARRIDGEELQQPR